MKPRLGEEEVRVTKNVAPAQCPHCQNELRGKEQIYYSLNFLHSAELDYLKGLQGVYKEFQLGLSKLFTTQEKDFTRKSGGEKEKEQEKDFLDEFLIEPKSQSPREQLLDDLAWLLEREVPDDPYLYKPWEKALNSISQGVRKHLGKKRFGEACAELAGQAIEKLAGRRGEYPLKNATSPTRPVIELVLGALTDAKKAEARESNEPDHDDPETIAWLAKLKAGTLPYHTD